MLPRATLPSKNTCSIPTLTCASQSHSESPSCHSQMWPSADATPGTRVAATAGTNSFECACIYIYVFHKLLINTYLKHFKMGIKNLFLINRHFLKILLKFYAETLKNGATQQNGFADHALGQPPKDMLGWQEKLCHTYRGLPRSCQGTSPLNSSQFVFGAGCAVQPSLLSSMWKRDSAKNSWHMHIWPETTHNRD